MGQLCAVSFTRHGRLFYLQPGPFRPQVGDRVLVPTTEGPEVAECVWAPQDVAVDTAGFPELAGPASDEDLARTEEARRRRAEARVAARRLVREAGLPMKVVGVDWVPPGTTTVYFTAPHRVDFRVLVRDLSAALRSRVVLRQVSARDEARLQGGIGSCGRDLCCATFLTDFEPVAVRMAKEQDLPVNPMRISGACGRLLCCLKYEHPLYERFRAEAPAVGSSVVTPQGEGRVVAHRVPAEEVTVRLADGTRCGCSLAAVCGPRQAYEAGQAATLDGSSEGSDGTPP